MSKVTLGIRRITPIVPTAAVRRKRTYADSVECAAWAADMHLAARRSELRRPSQAALARIIYRARRQKR